MRNVLGKQFFLIKCFHDDIKEGINDLNIHILDKDPLPDSLFQYFAGEGSRTGLGSLLQCGPKLRIDFLEIFKEQMVDD